MRHQGCLEEATPADLLQKPAVGLVEDCDLITFTSFDASYTGRTLTLRMSVASEDCTTLSVPVLCPDLREWFLRSKATLRMLQPFPVLRSARVVRPAKNSDVLESLGAVGVNPPYEVGFAHILAFVAWLKVPDHGIFAREYLSGGLSQIFHARDANQVLRSVAVREIGSRLLIDTFSMKCAREWRTGSHIFFPR